MSALKLLQYAVAAKLRYWDANRVLEQALCDDDIPDRHANAIESHIEFLAAGLNEPEDAYTNVDESHLKDLKEELT